MTEEENALVTVPGGAMALPADLVGSLEDLAVSGEDLGGTLLDMLAIYTNDKGRWKCGETKKDTVLGIYLHGFAHMRSFWPPEAPMGKESPHCWSFGGEEAVPVSESADPQSPTCEKCPWNEFETARQGKGKACKTKRADFLIEVDEDKVDFQGGKAVIDSEAVLGIALIRSSATAKETRQSIGQWAKNIQTQANGIPQLVLTRWALEDVPGPAGDYSAPILACVGTYACETEALEEIVQTARDLREGQAAEMITTLAGKADTEEEA